MSENIKEVNFEEKIEEYLTTQGLSLVHISEPTRLS